MENNFIELLKENIGDVEIEEVDMGDKAIEEIKSNFIEFGKHFILLFDNFRKCFKNSENKDIIKYLDKYKAIGLELVSLSQFYNSPINYGMGEEQEKLIQYVKDNYYDMVDFLDLYEEVFQE